jgi:hypothetical protein
MRRFPLRHIFTACAALSLLLCVAVGVLWVRSYWLSETIERFAGDQRQSIGSNRGTITFNWAQFRPLVGVPIANSVSPPFTRYRRSESYHPSVPTLVQDPGRKFDYRMMGFRVASSAGGRVTMGSVIGTLIIPPHITLGAPHWFLLTLLAILPIMRLAPRRRRRPGWCQNCGYDLRASPDRCPECGTPAPASPASAVKGTAA